MDPVAWLLEEGFEQKSDGFYCLKISLWFCDRYPSIYHVLEKYVLENGLESALMMSGFTVYIIVDPIEMDFNFELWHEDEVIESFFPDETQRVERSKELLNDIRESAIKHTLPF